MKFLKSLKKNCNAYNLFLVLVVVVILFMIHRYSQSKGLFRDNMEVQQNSSSSSQGSEIMAADNSGNGLGAPMAATGLTTSGNPGTSCNNAPVMNPNDLLPSDQNSEWARLNPADNDLKNMNFLKAGHHVGINTVGQSLRNPNLQLRSEPPNPQLQTGPWNTSTMDGDTMRRSLEIGGME